MAIFQYGIFFDLPVLTLLLLATTWLAARLDAVTSSRRLVRISGFVLSSWILICIEENINCGQFDCKTALWPPTMTFLLIFLGVVGGLAVLLRVKRVGVFVAFACLLGLAFEVSLGGSAPAFRALSPTWFVAISALTLVSYACIFYLPLRLLLGPLPINLNRR